MMHFSISSIETDIKQVSFSEMSLGKSLAGDLKNFELVIPMGDFLQKFGSIYDECIGDLIEDDKITGRFHPPYNGATCYPALDVLFQILEPDRMEFIKTYFVFDILRLFFSEDSTADNVKWIIQSLDSILCVDNLVKIKGVLTNR